MASATTTRMGQWLDYRVRVEVNDKRKLVGTFMAYDKFMNLVLSDCEEFRLIKVQGEEKEIKRVLGFVMLRGETVLNMTAEAPPVASLNKDKMATGPGKAVVAGRGGAMVSGGPAGLAAPVRGVGAPSNAQMQPRGQAPRVPGMPPTRR